MNLSCDPVVLAQIETLAMAEQIRLDTVRYSMYRLLIPGKSKRKHLQNNGNVNTFVFDSENAYDKI